jgi:hypothetical protein
MTDVALVPAGVPEGELAQLRPTNVQQLLWFAKQVAESGLFKVSERGGNKRNVTQREAFLQMSQGVELGLTPLQGMRELNIIDGRVDIPASVRAAKIAASRKTTQWEVDADDTFCTIRAKRADRSNGVEVTVRAEDLPSSWRTRHADHLEDSLYARAVRRISRQYFPDLNLGMETDSYPVETVVDARVERLAQIEQEAGTSDGEYGLHDECGGVLELHTNTRTGGAFLRCPRCNASFPPPQSIRDAYHAVEASPEIIVDGAGAESYIGPAEEPDDGFGLD